MRKVTSYFVNGLPDYHFDISDEETKTIYLNIKYISYAEEHHIYDQFMYLRLGDKTEFIITKEDFDKMLKDDE